jgi:hypothetical protein
MGNAVLASLIQRETFTFRGSLSRFQAGEHQASSVHESRRKSGLTEHSVKGLILAQNERWRHGLGMQVERMPFGKLDGGSGERGSNTWITYPGDGHSRSNERVIPSDSASWHQFAGK